MITATIPDNESERLGKLIELGILDTLEEQAYDDLTALAAEICQTPISLVSLIDDHRQWFKSHHGLDARETPRDLAFCAHAILEDEVFVVEDSALDERFHDNPLATDAPHVKFYAGAPLIMGNNLKLGTLCVISNEARTITTAQKEALKALARQVVTQFELRLKVKSLQSLDHAKDEFVSMVSHELRTPLTAIYGALSLLQNVAVENLDGQQKKLVDVSYRNSERLLCLVNDILDLAKLESGKLDIATEPVNMQSLLTKSVELNDQYCRKCKVNVQLHCPDNQPAVIVEGDEQRLLQVMSNLISNAAKFTFEGDTIEIYLSIANGFAQVDVTDHGAGIPLEQQNLIFTKFKQLDNQMHKKMPGTGLGLNISKMIVELLGGKIGFTSTPDLKTTFYFKLPIIDVTSV